VRKLKPADGSTRRDLFIRFRTQFVLQDMRYTTLSDGAQALYVWLTAQALEARREVLNREYGDVPSLSSVRRRRKPAIAAALKQLTTGDRPLVEILPDGKVRVVGIRKVHGKNFGWNEEPQLVDMYHSSGAQGSLKSNTSDTPSLEQERDVLLTSDSVQDVPCRKASTPHTPSATDNGTARMNDMPSTTTTTDGEAKATATLAAFTFETTEKLRPEAARAAEVISGIMGLWDMNGFDDLPGLLRMVGRQLHAGHAQAVLILARVHSCAGPVELMEDGDLTPGALSWARAQMRVGGPTPKVAEKPVRLGKGA